MRIAKFLALWLAVFALLAPVVNAGGFASTGIGTKARAMSGAFRAIADDWTAAYYNPAGYALITDNQLGSSLSVLHPRDELIPNYRWGGTYETGIFNGRTNYNDHEIISTPSGGFLMRLPLWGEMVVGLSAYQPFDYALSWELYSLPSAYNDTMSLPHDQYTSDLDVVAFQLTAAREFTPDKLAVGVGLEVLRGDLLFSNVAFFDNPMPAPYSDRPYDKIPQWSHVDGSGWGFGLRAGMMYKINDKLNLGVTAHLPSDITISGSASQVFYMPRLQYTTYPQGSVGYLFTAGQRVDYTSDFEATLSLPPSLAFGLAYDVNEKLRVAFDAEYTFWSRFDGLEFKYTDSKGPKGAADTSQLSRDFFLRALTIPADWKGSGSVMLGVTYELNNTLTLMAGGSADQSPIRDSRLFTPQFVDTGDKYSLSGGATVHINRWDLGLVQTYSSLPELSISPLIDVNGDGVVDNFSGHYEGAVYETVLSFNYRF